MFRVGTDELPHSVVSTLEFLFDPKRLRHISNNRQVGPELSPTESYSKYPVKNFH